MDLLIFQAPILMVQASMDGILLGILFALIAYGMALQWGVMNIINIAQGELVIMVDTLHIICIYQEFTQPLELLYHQSLCIVWVGECTN